MFGPLWTPLSTTLQHNKHPSDPGLGLETRTVPASITRAGRIRARVVGARARPKRHPPAPARPPQPRLQRATAQRAETTRVGATTRSIRAHGRAAARASARVGDLTVTTVSIPARSHGCARCVLPPAPLDACKLLDIAPCVTCRSRVVGRASASGLEGYVRFVHHDCSRLLFAR